MADKPAIRLAILQTVKDASPAPCNTDRLAVGIEICAGERLERKAVIAECLELETRGYLVNLKHSLDPVYKGITGAAADQLAMAVKLDPALWGDAAL